jgi:hypothetical protein
MLPTAVEEQVSQTNEAVEGDFEATGGSFFRRL